MFILEKLKREESFNFRSIRGGRVHVVDSEKSMKEFCTILVLYGVGGFCFVITFDLFSPSLSQPDEGGAVEGVFREFQGGV